MGTMRIRPVALNDWYCNNAAVSQNIMISARRIRLCSELEMCSSPISVGCSLGSEDVTITGVSE